MADIWSQQLNKEKLKKKLKYPHSSAFSHNYLNNDNLFTHYKLHVFQLLEGGGSLPFPAELDGVTVVYLGVPLYCPFFPCLSHLFRFGASLELNCSGEF